MIIEIQRVQKDGAEVRLTTTKRKAKNEREKECMNTDSDRENEVRDLEPAKDAKGGGGFKPRQRWRRRQATAPATAG